MASKTDICNLALTLMGAAPSLTNVDQDASVHASKLRAVYAVTRDAALRAHVLFHKDQHYVVQNGEVVIVDEFTGRLMSGRRWSDGLHQAVEAGADGRHTLLQGGVGDVGHGDLEAGDGIQLRGLGEVDEELRPGDEHGSGRRTGLEAGFWHRMLGWV